MRGLVVTATLIGTNAPRVIFRALSVAAEPKPRIISTIVWSHLPRYLSWVRVQERHAKHLLASKYLLSNAAYLSWQPAYMAIDSLVADGVFVLFVFGDRGKWRLGWPVNICILRVSGPVWDGFSSGSKIGSCWSPSQTVFSAIAPTLEHFGVLEIALTGADWTRRSQEIVAPSGSSGSSMPIASLAPEWACGRRPPQGPPTGEAFLQNVFQNDSCSNRWSCFAKRFSKRLQLHQRRRSTRGAEALPNNPYMLV